MSADLELYRPVLIDRATARHRDPADLVAAWLFSLKSDHTRDAYRRDIADWFTWLAQWGTHAMTAERGHADAWARWMENNPGPRGRPASKATVNRRLSSASAFYEYCVQERVIDYNPIKHVKRHKMNKRHSPTFRPSPEQLNAILDQARAGGARTWALVAMLVFSGARVSEVLGADIDDLTTDMSQRVLRVVRKGGIVEDLPLNPVEIVGAAVDTYLAQRAETVGVRPRDLSGPLFLDRGGKTLTRQAAANLVARMGARAACPDLTPHGLRHAFATIATLAGAKKDDLQVWLGHQSGETTDRYIGRVRQYDSHPGRLIAEFLGALTTEG